MSGKPGRSGKGLNAPWVEALRVVSLRRDADGVRYLRRMAQKTLEMALAGDLGAIQEIGNRLDGKQAQSTTVALTHTHQLALSDGQLAELVERFERKMLEGTPVVEVDGEGS